ncbi:hypothetical protein PtA15_9A640 [Puccinia triticina]|uniref:Uncharacterized protein n=1 Tax=Puccinia triticina TaxID=208348 RepID=A0ABY7CVZ3_9BASI|nr:uncharacterized protein PtA15_9A640 [Puccinia triticina]WAQ88513.1 hypothetical protein PtA15_9A640 [Puccinia triticina]
MCTGSVADPNGTSVQTLQVQLQLDGTRPASRETDRTRNIDVSSECARASYGTLSDRRYYTEIYRKPYLISRSAFPCLKMQVLTHSV